MLQLFAIYSIFLSFIFPICRPFPLFFHLHQHSNLFYSTKTSNNGDSITTTSSSKAHLRHYSLKYESKRRGTIRFRLFSGHFVDDLLNNLETVRTESKSRKGDFSLVKEALLGYQEMYGNLLVPKHYVIPCDDENYSQAVKGMKLGTIVQRIRNCNAYKIHQEELFAMGFNYTRQLRQIGILKEAFQSYKDIENDLLVRQDYIVPLNDTRYSERLRGMKLGKDLNKVRCMAMFQEYKEELTNIGVDYDKQKGDFDLLMESLLVFKSIHGNCSVPHEYVVSILDKRYPKRMRGNDLGRRVKSIEELNCYTQYREELLSIGMEFTFQPVPFQVFKAALETYKKLHGDCYVPYKYDTRDDSSYPEEMRGSNKLYKHVNCIRTGHIYQGEECRRALQAIGFDYHKKKGDFKLVRQSLLVYKDIYGDLLVPYEFKIPPSDTRYPTQMRGKNLGKLVNQIRNNYAYKEYYVDLLAIGFNFARQVREFTEVREALLAYRAIYGNMVVPYDYIIPTEDFQYPEGVRGMKLGHLVSNIRNCHCYKRHKEELLAIGFDYDSQEKGDFNLVKNALQAYKKIYGNVLVPKRFIIPVIDDRFPEECKGMKLGNVVHNIRNMEHYKHHKEELLAIGLDFGKQQSR